MERKKIKLMLISFFTIIITLIFSNKVLAYSKVDENEIRYVNATLTKINGNEYNTKMRGMSLEQYWNYSEEERKNIDQRYMLFGSAGVPGVSVISAYNPPNQNAGKLFQGLASENLVNNNLWISKFNNGESFFPTEDYASANSNLYTEILRDWKFPFKKEANGYYSFNSNDYVVQRNYNSRKLEMYTGSHYCFYPFNNLGDDCTDVYTRQYFYTMRLDISYTMPTEGKVNGQDMIFNFAGDDDVWVYIDGKLAVDIGGAHPIATGNLNFATNTVYYPGSYDFQAKTVYNVLNEEQRAEGKHTLTIFYMDRGDGESNFISRFNLQSGGIKTNYIDKATGKVIASQTKTTETGESINTSAKQIEGYTLIESPVTEKYTVTDEIQEVNYYYAKNTKVNVKYIDSNTGNSISNMITINGYEGKDYTTEKKNIDNYVFLRSEGSTSGKMSKEESTVNYYYAKTSKVEVKYLEQGTNAVLGTEIIDGYEGKTYTTQKKTFNNYTYVSSSSNTKGNMGRNTIEVKYYYLQNTSLEVRYIDKAANKILATETKNGLVGDKVKTVLKQIEGYSLIQSPSKEEYTLTKEKQVVNYYYAKNTKIIVKYVDKANNQNINADVIINGYEGKDYVTEKKNIDNYTFVESVGTLNGKMPRETTTITYKYLYKCKLTVNYIDKYTGKILSSETKQGLETEKVKTTSKQIEKYSLIEEPSKEEYTYTKKEQVINYYYAKNTKVTVKYIDKITNSKLTDNITIEGYEGKSYLTQKKEFQNYVLAGIRGEDKGSMQREEITVTYTYLYKENIIINYIDKSTGKILDADGIRGVEGDKGSISAKQIEGYSLIEKPSKEKYTITKETQTFNYYYAKNTKVVVKYVNEITGREISEQTVIEGYEGKDYATEKKNIDNYIFLKSEGITSGKMLKEEITIIYYYSMASKVNINYLEKDTNMILAKETIEGYQGKEYSTIVKDIPNYTYISSSKNTQGIMSYNTIEVNYYYLQNTSLEIRYIDKSTGEILSTNMQSGLVGDIINTSEKKIEGYTLLEKPPKEQYVLEKQKIVVNYYYAKNVNIIVKYVDKITNKELVKDIIIPGYEGKMYETEQKDIKDYTFCDMQGENKGVMSREDITIIYKYLYNGKVIVNYVDKNNEQILDKKEILGLEGNKIKTEPIEIEKYILVEKPEKEEINISKNVQTATYYYSHISNGVVEKHIDIMNNEILGQKVYKGKEGDSYTTQAKNFEEYDLVKEKLPKNAKGKMTIEPIEVKYYYVKKSQVIVNYIDRIKNKLLDSNIITAYEGDNYKAERKEFKDYKLDSTCIPSNEEGKVKKETIEVNYYYAYKSSGVKVNYIDEINKKIIEKEELTGYEGDEYSVYPKAIKGYEIVEKKLPKNSQGKMEREVIEVNYYYLKKSTIEVNHIDINTNKTLKQEIIVGVESGKYTTYPKEFLNYEIVKEKLPKNDQGTFTEKVQTINYYYIYKSKLIINHIEKSTGKVLYKEEIEGYENSTLQTKEREIVGYKLAEKPANEEYRFYKRNGNVNYYYTKDVIEESKKVLPKTGVDDDITTTDIEIIAIGTIVLGVCKMKRITKQKEE